MNGNAKQRPFCSAFFEVSASQKAEELEDFSAKFRKSLETAESTAAKTLSIEEDLTVEEVEKIKFEKQHIELEMEEVRVLSM